MSYEEMDNVWRAIDEHRSDIDDLGDVVEAVGSSINLLKAQIKTFEAELEILKDLIIPLQHLTQTKHK